MITGAGVGLTGAGAGLTTGAGATRTGAGVKCGALKCGATLIAEKIKAEITLLLQVGKGGTATRLAICGQASVSPIFFKPWTMCSASVIN